MMQAYVVHNGSQIVCGTTERELAEKLVELSGGVYTYILVDMINYVPREIYDCCVEISDEGEAKNVTCERLDSSSLEKYSGEESPFNLHRDGNKCYCAVPGRNSANAINDFLFRVRDWNLR